MLVFLLSSIYLVSFGSLITELQPAAVCQNTSSLPKYKNKGSGLATLFHDQRQSQSSKLPYHHHLILAASKEFDIDYYRNIVPYGIVPTQHSIA